MLKIDISKARSFLSDESFNWSLEKAGKNLELIKQNRGTGAEWLGWRRILADPDDELLEQVTEVAASVRKEADVFVVCGIGGSYLGSRAVIEALSAFFTLEDGPEVVFAGHHMSGKYLDQLLEYLKKPRRDGKRKSVYLNVISKSGSTLETALSFRMLSAWMHEVYDDTSDRIICTTSRKGGVLNPLVAEFGYRKFIIPDDVGGRFSVLTPVGLLPVAVAGIDIRKLFYQAVSTYEALEKDPSPVVEYAAIRYGIYRQGKVIDAIASFEPQLHYLGAWLQQLMAESEAKEGKGIFPANLTYSTDLHSLGQLMQQGKRNLMETFLIVKNSGNDLRIKETEKNVDQLNYLAGKTFHEINTSALEGTIKAHSEGGVPTLNIIMDKLDEQHMGNFIYFFELATAIYCYCLGVNPFNQPGVEEYKKAMYNLLGRE